MPGAVDSRLFPFCSGSGVDPGLWRRRLTKGRPAAPHMIVIWASSVRPREAGIRAVQIGLGGFPSLLCPTSRQAGPAVHRLVAVPGGAR